MSTRLVTQTLTAGDKPAVGTVTFHLSTNFIQNSETDEVLTGPWKATLNPSGTYEIELPVSTTDDYYPLVFFYTAEYDLYLKALPSISFELPPSETDEPYQPSSRL